MTLRLHRILNQSDDSVYSQSSSISSFRYIGRTCLNFGFDVKAAASPIKDPQNKNEVRIVIAFFDKCSVDRSLKYGGFQQFLLFEWNIIIRKNIKYGSLSTKNRHRNERVKTVRFPKFWQNFCFTMKIQPNCV